MHLILVTCPWPPEHHHADGLRADRNASHNGGLCWDPWRTHTNTVRTAVNFNVSGAQCRHCALKAYRQRHSEKPEHRIACRYFILPLKAQWLLLIFGFRRLSLFMCSRDSHNKQQFLVLALVWLQLRRCLQCYSEASTNVGLSSLFSKCLDKTVSDVVLPISGFIPSRNAHPSIPRKRTSGYPGTCGNPLLATDSGWKPDGVAGTTGLCSQGHGVARSAAPAAR